MESANLQNQSAEDMTNGAMSSNLDRDRDRVMDSPEGNTDGSSCEGLEEKDTVESVKPLTYNGIEHPRYTLETLSYRIGISIARVRHILKTLYPEFPISTLKNKDFIDDFRSERVIFTYNALADDVADDSDEMRNVFEQECLEQTIQKWLSRHVAQNDSWLYKVGSILDGEVIEFDDENKYVTVKFSSSRNRWSTDSRPSDTRSSDTRSSDTRPSGIFGAMRWFLGEQSSNQTITQIGKVPYDEWDWEILDQRPVGVRKGANLRLVLMSIEGEIVASRRQLTLPPSPKQIGYIDSALILRHYPEKNFALIRTSDGLIGYLPYSSLILHPFREEILGGEINNLEVRLKKVFYRDINNKRFPYAEFEPSPSGSDSQTVSESLKKSLIGISSLDWEKVSIAPISDMYSLQIAYWDKDYIKAEVDGVNSGGYLMHPVGNRDIKLFCFFRNGPGWISPSITNEMVGSQWIVKIEQDPEEVGSNNTKVSAKLPSEVYSKMVKENECYQATVVNINDAGAYLLIEGYIPAFMPNSKFGWDKNATAMENLNLGEKIFVSVCPNYKKNTAGQRAGNRNELQQDIICSQRDTTVDPWKGVKEVCPKGSVVEANLVSKNETGVMLSVGVYKAWLPANEISWLEKYDDCQNITLPNEIRVLVKGYDDANKNIKVSLKDLTPEPWSEIERYLPKEMVEKAEVTSLTNSGAFLKVGNLGFSGYLSYREVDWTHYTDQNNFPYRVGDLVEVKIIQINKDRRLLNCSIKALQSNPWLELQGKERVEGCVVRVDPSADSASVGALVRLDSGIECYCKERFSSDDEGKTMTFNILHLNIGTQKIAISHRKKEIEALTILSVGEMFKPYRNISVSDKELVDEFDEVDGKKEAIYRNFTIANISPTGVVTAVYAEEDKAYENGILLPSALKIKGHTVNVIFARHIIKAYLKVGQAYRFQVTQRYQGFNYVVLSFDAADLLDIENIATDDIAQLVSREGIEATVLKDISTTRNIFVYWRGYLGYIPRQEVLLTEEELTDTLHLRAIASPAHPAQMIRFTLVDNQEEEEDLEQQSSDEVLSALDSDLLDCYNNATSLQGFNPKLPDYYPLVLQIRYDPETYPQLGQCLSSEPAYFTSQTFFLDAYRSKTENGYILSVFNDKVSITCFCREKADGCEFCVNSCDFDQSLSSKKGIHFSRPLRIAGENIQIVPTNSSAVAANGQDIVTITTLLKYNRQVLPQLRKLSQGYLAKRGEHYLTLQELLKMDAEREETLCKETVKIIPTEITEAPGSQGGYGIEFNAFEQTFDNITSADDSLEEGIRVKFNILDDESLDRKSPKGVLRYLGSEKWRIELYKDNNIEIEDLRTYGLQVKRDPNLRHINRQIRAIDSFVYERNGLDIFSKIVRNKLKPVIPPKNEEISANEFFNLEDDSDSQANALKMALGGSQITLIQGPPGTGKSTVIVDIIRNLVKRHKKVLVCTQSVAPVEELFYKLSGRKDRKAVKSPQEIDGTPLRCAYLKDDDSIEYSGSVEEHRQAIKDMMLLLKHLNKLNDNNPQNNGAIASDEDNYASDLNDTPFVDNDSSSSSNDSSSSETSNGTTSNSNKEKEALESLKARHSVECSEVRRKFDTDILPDYNKIMDVLDEYQRALDKKEVQDFVPKDQKRLNLEAVDVVFGTCVGVGVSNLLKDLHFDTLIIDEAGKANYAESLVPMMMADEYILVGDEKQLPPFTNSELVKALAQKRLNEMIQEGGNEENGARERPTLESIVADIMEDVGKSLFGDLKPRLAASNQIMLSKQFRMHPQIGDFVSKLFYQGKVQSVPKPSERNLNIEGLEDPIQFIDTSSMGNEAREKSLNNSLYNDGEIQVIEQRLMPMLEAALEAGRSVGILSPYAAQVLKMKQRFPKLSRHIFTIDSIQGEEYDIVVFSFVRNTNHGTLNFVDDLRRLNVSFSRAKCNLIMIGHLETLQNESLHKIDREAVMTVYDEIQKTTVKRILHLGAMQQLYVDFPPECCPLLRNLDHTYYKFEDCRKARKENHFTSRYAGQVLTIYNPILEDFVQTSHQENFVGALIGYQDDKPYTILYPMALWLSKQQSLYDFEFSAVVYSENHSSESASESASEQSSETASEVSMKASPLILKLSDKSLLSLNVPSSLKYPKGTKVKINVRDNKTFTLNPIQDE